MSRRRQASERAGEGDPPEIPDDYFFLADMADIDAVTHAFEGMDVVVHLAADPRPDASWDQLLESNIVGARNAFEAAVRAGVKRVIYPAHWLGEMRRHHSHRPESGAVWSSRRDVVQLIQKIINAPEDLHFDMFYGVSNNKWRWVAIDHAREILGHIRWDSAEVALEQS